MHVASVSTSSPGSRALTLALLALVTVAAAACSGGPSTDAPQVTPAFATADLQEACSGMDDREPTIVERARKGLDISPVAVDTDGLHHRYKVLVGLGSYIVNAAADCAGCHGNPPGFLAGGNPFFLDAQGHVVWSRNLTPDPETGMQLSFGQFREALRTGRDFHPGQTKMLVVMPWLTKRWASDLDLAAMYAYLRSVPAVNNAVPPDNKDALPLPPSIPFPKGTYTDGDVERPLRGNYQSFSSERGLSISPLANPTGLRRDEREKFGVGAYIANSLMACNDCHTNPDRTAGGSRINTAAFLTGGAVFGVPPPLQPLIRQVRATSANLKGATHGFFAEPDVSYAIFRDIIQTGTHADETPPRPLGFPMNIVAASLRNLVDYDLQAVYAYVSAIPPTTGNDEPRQGVARWCAGDGNCASGETCAIATGECVGRACSADVDCDTCQTCGSGKCQAPAAGSACLASAR
jgi:cytochrome c553